MHITAHHQAINECRSLIDFDSTCFQLNGFLGGVHMAILAAFVCGYQPNATLSSLLANFFYTFAHWQWPTPVVLLEDTYPSTGAPPGLMPIQLPCGSHQYCNSTITRSTFYKIVAEFLLGHNLTKVESYFFSIHLTILLGCVFSSLDLA